MKRLHGLVISWYYPPGNSSEGLITYKLLKNSSFSYDVFTRDIQNANVWDRDVDESKLTAENVTVYKGKSRLEADWVNEVVEFFEQHADEYDFVMSRIMSKAAHIAAARIKDLHPNIFWVASFGDPMVNSPYMRLVEKFENPFFLKQYYVRELPSVTKTLKLAISPTRTARKIVWEKDRIDSTEFARACKIINDETFEKADLLVFNNPQQYKLAFSDGYAKYEDKGAIINHSFDTSLYPKKTKKNNDGKVHFVYVGHLDDLRNAKPVFDAIGTIKQHDSELGKKVQFDFYGHIDDLDKVAIIDNNIADLVSLHGDITYLESLEKISEADWLLLIDANLTRQLEEYIYLPAKLMDYLGAKKNILAVTQTSGTTADVIKTVKAGKTVTHCANDIAIYLAKIIYQGYSPAAYDENALEKYDAATVADTFDKLIMEKLQG